MKHAAAVVLLLVAACSDSGTEVTMMPVGGCDGLLSEIAGEPGVHVPVGSPIAWSTNPPATGMHYPSWAGWDREYGALDRGFYVHNAEHGGVALLYRCDTACPEVVDALRGVARGMAADPTCTAPVRNRVVITADPLLPDGVQVAAIAWNAVYTASCFDPYVATFAREHYRHGPEDLCNDGNPIGGTFIDP